MSNFLLLMAITVGAGAFGGYGSYLIRQIGPDGQATSDVSRAEGEGTSFLWHSIILGVIAAGLIPAFLAVVSGGQGSILNGALKGDDVNINRLVYFGFCLLAGVSGQSFVGSMSSKLFGQMQEVKERVNRIDLRVLAEKMRTILSTTSSRWQKISIRLRLTIS